MRYGVLLHTFGLQIDSEICDERALSFNCPSLKSSTRLVQKFMTVPPEISSQSELLLDTTGATRPGETPEVQVSLASSNCCMSHFIIVAILSRENGSLVKLLSGFVGAACC